MPDKKIFIDSNILIYALSQENSLSHKKQIAVDLLCQHPILSTQIINECSNVLRRKFNWDYQEIQETLEFTLKITTFSDVTLSTI